MRKAHAEMWVERMLWMGFVTLFSLAFCASPGAGQAPGAPAATASPAPFVAGESLTYDVRVGSHAAGQGTMTITGPVDIRGVSTLLLRSKMHAASGPFSGSGVSESWLDSRRMTSLRFRKQERRVLARHREAVEMFPRERRWTSDDGRAGTSPTDMPLDELSFIYFIRTLPLAPDAAFSFSRHFEAGRNPVSIRVVGRERTTVRAGTFATVVVEMRVKDPRNYEGEGVIRIHLTDDDCKLPVRIESVVPKVGRTVLSLTSVVHPDAHCQRHGP